MDMDVFRVDEVSFKAICNFSMDNPFGAGGFGRVYRGVLTNSTDVIAMRILQGDCNDAQKLGDPFPVKTFQEDEIRLIREERSARTLLRVAATSLASLTYSTGISPPGGFWEERTTHSYNSGHHRAAEDNSNQAPKNAPLQTGWRVASAVANHLTGNLSILTDYTSFPGGRAVNVPNQGRMEALGSGSVKTHNVVLQNVWYVPGLEMNLVSAGQLTKLGHKVCFGPYGCRISKGSDDNVIGKARFTDDFQFEVDFVKVPPPN